MLASACLLHRKIFGPILYQEFGLSCNAAPPPDWSKLTPPVSTIYFKTRREKCPAPKYPCYCPFAPIGNRLFRAKRLLSLAKEASFPHLFLRIANER
jgi:hypothetical protein